MGWTVLFAALMLFSGAGLVANIARLLFEHRVAAERAETNAAAQAPGELVAVDTLPAPVRRYLERCGAERGAIRSVRLSHGGTARMKPDAKTVAIHGEQLVTTSPPSFVWHGRIHMAPGVWVDARDRLVDGRANMLVVAESLIPIQDVSGPELDQGAAIRWLGELVWAPTAYRDRRYVTWTAIDESTARATLTLEGRAYSADFHFGSDGLPTKIVAERYREADGKSVLTRWYGRTYDYRRVSGILVPFQMEAVWALEGGEFAPFHFVVEKIAIDPAEAREVTAALATESP